MAKRRRSKAKHRKHSTRRRRRRNGAGLGRSAFLTLMAKGKAKARKHGKRRKTRAKGRKRSASGRRIRPTILLRGGKLYRPRRSKYFPRSRRVNGRRRRRNGSRSIVGSIKSVFKLNTISRYVGIGGGIFAGTLFSRLLNTGIVPFTSFALPAAIMAPLQKLRPVHGLLHMFLGIAVASKVKNKCAQDIGVGIAALGGFDIVMQVLSRMGVAGLPTFSGMNVDLVSGRTMYRVPGMSGMNVNLRTNQVMAGMARASDAESDHLADNINDMLS